MPTTFERTLTTRTIERGDSNDCPTNPTVAFARHETFAPRYGWLKKTFDALTKDRALFLQDDAALRLGVGKNMARAMRYWALAFGIVEESSDTASKGTGKLQPTKFGTELLGPNGWDPFLEDVGSLWLLHWQLLRADGLATAWRYAFFEFGMSDFSADDLTAALEAMVRKRHPTARAATSSLRKDAACILLMYSGSSHQAAATEESIRSPFVQLDLLGPGTGARHVTFRVGEKPELSPFLIGALCMDFLSHKGSSLSVSFTELLRGDGSPGLALRLTEAVLYSALETIVRIFPEINLADSAGIIALSVTKAPDQIRHSLISAHYSEVSS